MCRRRKAQASLAMQQVLDRVYEELKKLPGVKHVVTIAGTGYLQQVNNSRVYVRLDDIENRVFSISRLAKKTLQGKPGRLSRASIRSGTSCRQFEIA